MEVARQFAQSQNKNVRLSVATVALNASSYMLSSSSTDSAELLITLICTILDSRLYESEAITRVLIALGTALLLKGNIEQVVLSMNVLDKVLANADQHGEKAQGVAREILSILSG